MALNQSSLDTNKEIIMLWSSLIQKLSSSNDPDYIVILEEIVLSQQLFGYIWQVYQFDCPNQEASFIELSHTDRLAEVIQVKTLAAERIQSVIIVSQLINTEVCIQVA